MKEALTIRDAGAAGIELVIADGMRAAAYARELDAMTAERDVLEAKVRRMEAVIRVKDRENERLRVQNRKYRQERQRDREAGAQARLASDRARPRQRLWNVVMMGLGGWITFVAVVVIIWGSRV